MSYSPVLFSKANAEAETEETHALFRDLCEMKREGCPEKAAAQDPEAISRCHACGGSVCDRYSLICRDLDLCIACVKTLQERDNIVAGEAYLPRELPAEQTDKISTEGDGTT